MERVFLRFRGQTAHALVDTASPAPGRCGPDERLAGLVEAFCFHAYGLLRGDGGDCEARRDAAALLAEWGFDPGPGDQLPMGLIVTPEAMHERLLADGFTREEIRRSKLVADRRLAGRLVGPITDMAGRITSFWARHPGAGKPAYLYWRGGWKEHIAAFGLQTALGAGGAGGRIVLVEDILDSLLLRSRGLDNAAALGDPIRQLDARRWQRLAAAGVRRVTLVADSHAGAEAGVLAVLEAAFAAEAAPSIDIVPPQRLAGARTPGDFVRRRGIDALRDLLAHQSVHAYALKAHDMLRRRRPQHGWSGAARRAAMNEAVAFYTWQSTRRRDTAELDAHFVPAIVEALGWPWGASEARGEPRPSGRGYCTLHACHETQCFCFD